MTDCSLQDFLVNVRTYAHLDDSHRIFGIHYEHYHWHRGRENGFGVFGTEDTPGHLLFYLARRLGECHTADIR